MIEACKIAPHLQLSIYSNDLAKNMLPSAPFATEIFFAAPGQSEDHFRTRSRDHRQDHHQDHPQPHNRKQADLSGRLREFDAMAVATVTPGDQVVFERLDLAEALGIWRHARGRVVGIHGQGRGLATIDVKFDGHETLQRYLPDLFRRVH
jgi:hypothetical protein